MKNKYLLKSLAASLVVTLALTGPAVVFSVEAEPLAEIHIEGAELRYVNDSVQAIFSVSVDRVANTTGASFFLDYNPDYLVPSNMADNAVLNVGATEYCDDFFQADPELYYLEATDGTKTPISPFDTKNTTDKSYLDLVNNMIHMALWLDQDAKSGDGVITTTGGQSGTILYDTDGKKIGEIGGKVELLEDVGYDGTTAYVFNMREDEDEVDDDPPGKVKLGYLSFRVREEHLAEMVAYFDGLDVSRDHRDDPWDSPWVKTTGADGSQGNETFLLDMSQNYPDNKDPWTVGYFAFVEKGDGYLKDFDYLKPDVDHAMVDHYKFDFDGKVIVNVEATDPDVTVNAYQNFTYGDKDDLPQTMGKYSPMVTVTYADGSKENIPFPWGYKDASGKYKDGYTVKQASVFYTQDEVDDWVDAEPGRTEADCPFAAGDPKPESAVAVTDANYDPTHGVYYFSQLYKWTDADGVEHTFPKPVTAKLTVTPITVIDVTAEDKEKTYKVTDVVDQVPNVNALNLPNQARIITDIVPSGVSLVTDIKGWKPAQADSVWPATNSSTAMNSLKADSYTAAAGVPYWPDAADKATSAVNTNPEKFIGSYSFVTSKADHATREDILRADIKAAFPWLTVPKESYDVGQAKRNIVSAEDFTKQNPDQYEVKWVSTVTEANGNQNFTPDSRPNGVGQPTLTLSVAKKTGNNLANYGAMATGSVFRVWLPNGLELGTGQVAGGVTVPGWFEDAPDKDHVHGYYDGTHTGTNAGELYFFLITNPDQPELNAYGAERETLRRYINLGGWYQVSVCEDPGAGDHWCAPIPVYVPPRRNEYTESKVYNFLGENTGLYNWPGGVGDTLYLPRGEYTPVGPQDGNPDAAGVGLPLYVKSGLAGVTDGLSNPGSNIFEPGNIHRTLDGVSRYEESYGVRTIYDGQTGAQPGVVYTVRVDKDDTTHTDPWYKPGTTDGTPAGNTHAIVGANPFYQYGATPLYEGIDQDGDGKLDGYQIMAFGRVFQPEDDPDRYTATVRREGEQKDAESVRIKLLSWDDEGITRAAPGNDFDNDNVTLVTYDTKMVGYTVRQDFTLTIKNVGTTDIYGLDIDGVLDGYDLKDNGLGTAMAGGHFEMLQPPASFLPVGGTTTFTLTYVYNLSPNVEPNTLHYRDTLYITANGHNQPGKGNTHDTGALTDQYLLDFDAQFAVSKDPLHKVDVIYRPENGNMGTANLIVGEQGMSAATAEMVYTSTSRTYAKDALVYVVVNKVDEYAIKSITATIDGVQVDLLANNKYRVGLFPTVTDFYGTADTEDMREVYVFRMPDHDVVVEVDFYEPFLSKLRLEDLIDFSAPTDDNDLRTAATATFAATPPDIDHQYRVWRKTFTTAERAAAAAWRTATAAADEDLYLMTQGTARPHSSDPDLEGQKFISSENQYLVVIDADADLSQVEAKIRRVVYHEDYQGVEATNYPNGYNYEIELNVQMDVYPYNVEKQTGGAYNWNNSAYNPELVYAPSGNSPGYGPRPAFTGTPRTTTAGSTGAPPVDYDPGPATSDSSIHTSAQFNSPAKGESKYVVITLSGIDPANPGGGTQYRYYYLEIHRKTDSPNVELHYGNSPYGMIMNEKRFTTTAMRDAAKAAFRKGYTFEGNAKTVVPDAVFDSQDMHHVTYWREAWVKNTKLFEPETLTGFLPVRNEDGTQVFSDAAKTKPIYAADKSVYDESENLDLNDYAYFAILGEDLREPGVIRAWDSSGREVDIQKITAVAMDVDWAENGKGLTLLDTTQTKQVARFLGNTTDFPIMDLGVQGRTLTFLAEHQPDAPATPLTVTGTHWPASSKQVTAVPAEGGDAVTTTEYSLIEDIRPGRYAIVYTYTDFDGTTQLQVDRPFVILRGVGDVNTDGKRNNDRTIPGTDEYHIEDRVGQDPLGYEAGGAATATEPHGAGYPYANIFKFRVCDVNNDRNVNNIDANQVDANIRSAGKDWLRFYHPTEYGLPPS